MIADPVSAFFGGLLALGLTLLVVLAVRSARDDTYQPVPPVSEPVRHVVPVRVGTCAMCGKTGVRVHLLRAHPLLDPEDFCDGCSKAEVYA